MSEPTPEHEPDGESGELWSAALASLRGELRRRLSGEAAPAGDVEAGAAAASFDWVALAEDLRRRLGQFGMRERSGEVDDFGLDPETIRSARPLFSLLRKRWWRIEVVGLEHVPDDQPVLFVANHSGLLPWDGLALAETIEEAHGAARRPRFLIADWLITLPFVQPALARLGGVRACRENAERLLDERPLRRRVSGGREGRRQGLPRSLPAEALRARRRDAARARDRRADDPRRHRRRGGDAPHPLQARRPPLRFGLPFLPVTPTFPLLGPLGALPLPSKWVVSIGEPLRHSRSRRRGRQRRPARWRVSPRSCAARCRRW